MDSISYFQSLPNIVRDTDKGIFGVSDVKVMNEFFSIVPTKGTFLDLGSGDGRIAIIAAEFFENSIGIEIDEKLVEESKQHATTLHSSAQFLCQDYEDYDYSDVDVLFSYADHFFTAQFIEKLKREFKGILYVYQGVFLPEHIKKGRTYWVKDTPIISYDFSEF